MEGNRSKLEISGVITYYEEMHAENQDKREFDERTIRFLREGLGKSDAEIEELRQNGEQAIQQQHSVDESGESEPVPAPVEEAVDEDDEVELDKVLEMLQKQREAIEEHLDSVAVNGEDSELTAGFEEYLGSVTDDYAQLEEQNKEMARTYREDLAEINMVLEELLRSIHQGEDQKQYRELNQRIEQMCDDIDDVLMTDEERQRSQEMIDYFSSAPRLTDY